MKKPYLIIPAITFIAGIVAFWLSQPPLFDATSSPSKTYTVELRGDKSRPRFPFIEHRVNFSVLKQGDRIVKNGYAHSGDWFDISFELAYPEHTWVNENILRFGRSLNVIESKKDRLSLANDSGKVIKYLRINANNMFLIFDMQPGSTLLLTPPHQSWLSWITCEGEFVDGGRISWNGVNFFHRDTLAEPMRYCVSVSYRGLRIQSPQIEGFDTNGSGDHPNVPQAKGCNPD